MFRLLGGNLFDTASHGVELVSDTQKVLKDLLSCNFDYGSSVSFEQCRNAEYA